MVSGNRPADWTGKSVLVVEDTDTSIMYYKAALKKTKAKLFYAKNGIEAIDIVKVDGNIDLVLMDINMPIMNGIEATKEIKKINPHIPIIIQTAYVLNDERIRCFEAGCDGFMAKPVKIHQLITTMEELL